MSNLLTYEMQMFMNDETRKKGKYVALVLEEHELGSEPKDETISLITKNFSKILKQINQQSR